MYEQYLIRLLAPLGIYDFSGQSISGAEIHALGAALDSLAQTLDWTERESITATAQEEGLQRREALFAHPSAAATLEGRRAAIAALLQIDSDSLTPSAINAALQGCGIQASAQEMGNKKLQVTFPQVIGEPPEYSLIQKIILDILPCHLEVEFYLRYLTWAECEAAKMSWASIEAAAHTWESFEKSVPNG